MSTEIWDILYLKSRAIFEMRPKMCEENIKNQKLKHKTCEDVTCMMYLIDWWLLFMGKNINCHDHKMKYKVIFTFFYFGLFCNVVWMLLFNGFYE